MCELCENDAEEHTDDELDYSTDDDNNTNYEMCEQR